MTHAEAGRLGGKKRASMLDFIEHQRAAGRRSAQVNDMAALGAKGAAVFAARYGYRRLIKKLRSWRLDHPSADERRVAAILDRLGIEYTRECIIFPTSEHPLLVDFALDGKRVIEVNGRPHVEPALNGGDPAGRRERDEQRLARLRRGGYRVLIVDHQEIGRAKERIQEFLVG